MSIKILIRSFMHIFQMTLQLRRLDEASGRASDVLEWCGVSQVEPTASLFLCPALRVASMEGSRRSSQR